VARHLHGLQELWTSENELGWEGVTAIANNLTKLTILWINENEEIGQGVTLLGKLPNLENLYAGTDGLMQGTLK